MLSISPSAVCGVSLLAVALQAPAPAQDVTPLRKGMVITSSIVLAPGTYSLPSASLEAPAIVIRGSNLTVDFNGAELVGAPIDAPPDTFAGLGLLVDGGTNVIVRNARIRGFKAGLQARDTVGFRLTRSDLSHNWKQRLYSLVEHESLADWMSYHDNERGQWLRYGAAVYLDGCRRCEIDHVTVVQGQNGLMMTRTEQTKVWNNSGPTNDRTPNGAIRSTGTRAAATTTSPAIPSRRTRPRSTSIGPTASRWHTTGSTWSRP